MSYVTVTDIRQKFGRVEVLEGISFEVERGGFVTLAGPSGCGKSTLLRLVAGLDPLTSGTIDIDGKRMNGVPARNRDIAFVFQSYALYPHMTVRENSGLLASHAASACGGSARAHSSGCGNAGH